MEDIVIDYSELFSKTTELINELIETCDRREKMIEECLELMNKSDQLNKKRRLLINLNHATYLNKLSIKIRMNVRRQFARTYWEGMYAWRYEVRKSNSSYWQLEYKATNNARIQIRQIVRHSIPYSYIEQVREGIRKLTEELNV